MNISRAAQLLGRMAKGKPKNFTEEERKKRSDKMRALNEKRKQAKG